MSANAMRHVADELGAVGVPAADAVEDGADAERGDEGVDLGVFDQHAVDPADQAAGAEW